MPHHTISTLRSEICNDELDQLNFPKIQFFPLLFLKINQPHNSNILINAHKTTEQKKFQELGIVIDYLIDIRSCEIWTPLNLF